MNAGATRFGSARGRLEISDGEARFVDIATKAPGLSLALTGAHRSQGARVPGACDGPPKRGGRDADAGRRAYRFRALWALGAARFLPRCRLRRIDPPVAAALKRQP